ncbi:MAG: rod shape-determining protein MreC [Candidatus Parcubacteria bacterium]|nr:rod shape-determining protein MreC [Candidatus Parcubacteria bacterium]
MQVERKNRLVKFYLIAVIILLIFFHYLGVLRFAENVFVNTYSSGQNKVYTFFTKLKYSFVNYQEAQNLKIENDQLKHQLNQLVFEKSQLESYKVENEKLRSFLNFKEDKKFDLVLANVIGKDATRQNILIINRGLADGIKEGFAAVVDSGIIIGKVIEAKDNISLILLLTDKQSQLAVSTENVNKTCGLAQGEYGLSLRVSLIPQDVEIKENDTFITSGAETNIPRGLICGKINRIISLENELFKSATISLPLDYNEITLLSIVIPKVY